MAHGGWYGTTEEWERIEQPLLDVDSALEEFASEVGITITRNYKDWPERSFVWGGDIRCLMQLYLVDVQDLTFNLWLCASQRRGRELYWKQETPIREQRVDQFHGKIADELREGHRKLIDWSDNPGDFEFATKLE